MLVEGSQRGLGPLNHFQHGEVGATGLPEDRQRRLHEALLARFGVDTDAVRRIVRSTSPWDTPSGIGYIGNDVTGFAQARLLFPPMTTDSAQTEWTVQSLLDLFDVQARRREPIHRRNRPRGRGRPAGGGGHAGARTGDCRCGQTLPGEVGALGVRGVRACRHGRARARSSWRSTSSAKAGRRRPRSSRRSRTESAASPRPCSPTCRPPT